jgi:putative sigma-54 modulation protein
MRITISSRHMELTAPLREYAEQKVVKLEKYYDRVVGVEVVLDNHKEGMRVEMIVSADHQNRFVSHHECADAYAGIDGCIGKLGRQLSEHKKKFRNRKHAAATVKRGTPAASEKKRKATAKDRS